MVEADTMNAVELRRLALSLPEAEEKSHFGTADFRVRNRIFASLPDDERAVVKLTSEQQEVMTAAEPRIFQAVKGGWGRHGWTTISLAAADEITLRSALTTAWRNVAPARLRKANQPTGKGGDE